MTSPARDGRLLLEVLAEPSRAEQLSIREWDQLLRTARLAGVIARLGYAIEDAGVDLDHCPRPAADMLRGARAYPEYVQVRVGLELRKVLQATAHLGTPFVLLKGAAYLKGGLSLSRGRMLSDLDVLVRLPDLPAVEQALLEHGWEHQKLDAYDQRYYREWMHEIPPLTHPQRRVEVDIHHRILPVTSRLNPSPDLLWAASVPLGEPRLRVLSPGDMILHSAAHLFQDGDLKGGFKQLLDLHQLFIHLGTRPDLWVTLTKRARQLQLERPFHYAVHFCSELLRTPIPPEVRLEAGHAAPAPLVRPLIHSLMRRALVPADPDSSGAPFAEWLLYVRSHWLRMPPSLLAGHLTRKALRRMARESVAKS